MKKSILTNDFSQCRKIEVSIEGCKVEITGLTLSGEQMEHAIINCLAKGSKEITREFIEEISSRKYANELMEWVNEHVKLN